MLFPSTRHVWSCILGRNLFMLLWLLWVIRFLIGLIYDNNGEGDALLRKFLNSPIPPHERLMQFPWAMNEIIPWNMKMAAASRAHMAVTVNRLFWFLHGSQSKRCLLQADHSLPDRHQIPFLLVLWTSPAPCPVRL